MSKIFTKYSVKENILWKFFCLLICHRQECTINIFFFRCINVQRFPTFLRCSLLDFLLTSVEFVEFMYGLNNGDA